MRFLPFQPRKSEPMTEEMIFKSYGQPLVFPSTEVTGLNEIASSIASSTPAELAHLDKTVRETSLYRSPEWQARTWIGTEEIERILQSADASVYLVGLVSFHHSGYIRELAVRRLAQITTGQELPFLLIRLNDWIPAVHEAALSAVQERITPKYAEALVQNIGLVFDLEQQKRHEHGPVLTALMGLLKRPECDAALQQGLASPEKTVRRLCFRVLEETDDVRLSPGILQKLTDDSPGIRLAAARLARTKLDVSRLREVLPTIRRDASMPVRREALLIYAERFPELAAEELKRSLLDTHASIRASARYQLQQITELSFADIYRRLLADASAAEELGTAISGLGETGSAVDVPLLLPYLTHPISRIRKAAIKAINKLDGERQIETLLQALSDELPRVTHIAREALRGHLSFLDGDKLWQIFRTNELTHVRLDLLLLLADLPKWESISYLLAASADLDSVIQDRAESYLKAWLSRYNHGFAKPSTGQLARLKEALTLMPMPDLEWIVREGERRSGWNG